MIILVNVLIIKNYIICPSIKDADESLKIKTKQIMKFNLKYIDMENYNEFCRNLIKNGNKFLKDYTITKIVGHNGCVFRLYLNKKIKRSVYRNNSWKITYSNYIAIPSITLFKLLNNFNLPLEFLLGASINIVQQFIKANTEYICPFNEKTYIHDFDLTREYISYIHIDHWKEKILNES